MLVIRAKIPKGTTASFVGQLYAGEAGNGHRSFEERLVHVLPPPGRVHAVGPSTTPACVEYPNDLNPSLSNKLDRRECWNPTRGAQGLRVDGGYPLRSSRYEQTLRLLYVQECVCRFMLPASYVDFPRM